MFSSVKTKALLMVALTGVFAANTAVYVVNGDATAAAIAAAGTVILGMVTMASIIEQIIVQHLRPPE